MFLFLLIMTFVASYVLTYFVKRYALHRGVHSVPEARSSHDVITPHGGGFAIAITFIAAVLIAYLLGYVAENLMIAISVCGGIIALVGFLDDHKPLSIRFRIVAQILCAVAALWLLGGIHKINYGTFEMELGIWGYVLGTIAIVWMTNLYNFMDGIDGFASIQAMTTTACMAVIILTSTRFESISDINVLLQASTRFESVWQINILLVASVLGFFLWNFPKAKIFMGDVGSYFLGFVLAVITIKSLNLTVATIFSWIILFAVFITDATYTFLYRLLTGQAVYEPHKTHAYQIISRKLKSHLKTSSLLACVNLCFLFPIAFIVSKSYIHPLTGFAIAYIPLILLAIKVGAGRPLQNF